MGEYQHAPYYDKLFTESPDYAKPATEAGWFPIWRALRALIPPEAVVIDLGCGPGQFASLLEFPLISRYVGVDFSSAALLRAQQPDRAHWGEFRLWDLTQRLPADLVDPAYTYVISETLEHLPANHGPELIRDLPAGATVVASLPSFDDQAHTFHISRLDEIPGLYGKYLDLDFMSRVGPWFAFRGIRNETDLTIPR